MAMLLVAGCDRVFGLTELAPPEVGPTSALVAWYPFDDLVTSVLVDQTGHGHDGTCAAGHCPVLATGHAGGAGSFDGILQRVEVPSFESPTFTITVWVQFDSASGYGCPINKPFGLATADSWQLCFDTGADGQQLAFYANDNLPIYAKVGTISSAWHHYALRWDGTAKALTFDGLDVASGPGAITSDGNPIVIGTDLNAGLPTAQFSGLIDDLRFYDRALTPAELTSLEP